MNRLWPLIKKELVLYANSAIMYVVGVFFLSLSALWLFSVQGFVANDVASLRPYFAFFPILFILLIPALTMRSWSEEYRQGTFELLVTLPYSEWKLVLAKFIAPLVMILVLLVFTLPVPLSAGLFGDFDSGMIFTEYFGVVLLAALGLAIGTFISSRTKNQVTAFLISVAVLVFLTLIDRITSLGDMPMWIVNIVNYVSLNNHVDGFIKGIVDTRDLIWFLAFTSIFLFMNERSFVLRKWR